MFRDADRRDRSMHESHHRPVPVFQQMTQAAKLDDSAAWDRRHALHPSQAPAVPTTFDTRYDPSHPDADWTGQVSVKNAQRKHCQDHSSQRLGIEQTEFGLMSKDYKKEWDNRRQHPEGDAKNGSQILLSGVGGDSERFRTEYRRQSEREGTSRDQLVLQKRLTTVKRVVDPAQARSTADRFYGLEAGGYNSSLNPGMGSMGGSGGPGGAGGMGGMGSGMGKGDGMGMGGGMGMGMGGQYSVTGAPYALSGQTSNHSNPQARAPRGNKSMLSDIGSQIASRINAPVPSGASNGAYESAYSKNRVMVGENHRAYPTGYTGGRKGL